MKRVVYSVVMSLDGYIAGSNGEADWIVKDSEVDFGEIFGQYDTLLVGRKTFEFMARAGNTTIPGMKTVVFSKTVRASDYPGVTVVSQNAGEVVASLRAEARKDLWLFGGGVLFQSLLELSLVDAVQVAIAPVFLGGGIPLLPSPAKFQSLKLTSHRVYAKTGTVMLNYAVT